MKYLAIFLLLSGPFGICQKIETVENQSVSLNKNEYFCSVHLIDGKSLSVILDKDLSIGNHSLLKGRTKEGKISIPISEIDSVLSAKSKYVRHEDKFLLLVSKGDKLSLFSRQEVKSRGGVGPNGTVYGGYDYNITIYYVYKPGLETIIEVPKKKKDFVKFGEIFSDCQYIHSAIKSGRISYDGLAEIVRMYNMCK